MAASYAQRRTLEEWSGRDDDPGLARRARIVLEAIGGATTAAIARDLGVSRPTVALWRRRFAEGGLDAVAKIKDGRGRRPSLPPRTVRLILEAGRQPPPPGHTRWTVRAMAAYAGVSPDTVQRLWRDHGLRPHQGEVAPVVAGDPGGDGARQKPEPAARGPVDPATHNLPAPFSSFVGRGRELADIASLLADSRLVTLTGCPGIGKSRLALETATRLTAEQPGGACFVELGAVREDRQVAQGVAAALGTGAHAGEDAGEDADEDLIDVLVAELQDRRLLLVLDNCEHVLPACAGLAGALLRACPQVTVLATSQERLGIPGEHVWQVPPLGLPAEGGDETTTAAEAVRLFCERATAQSEAFTLTPAAAADVVEICRRLDGNPLAIELAAARAGALGPAGILERLEQRFRLLTSGRREGPERHRTLEAAIGWSFDLLSEPQQVLLRRLSVFAGDISVEAAERVCTGDGLDDDVFYLLAGLVERSLVVAEVAGRHARYRLLESIGEFARHRLEQSGEAPRVRARFTACYSELVEQAEPELAGPAEQQWLERLETEHDNIVAAIDCSLSGGDAAQALRLAGGMASFWRLRGHLRKGQKVLDRCLDATEQQVGDPARAKASWGAGLLAALLGDFATARARGEECRAGAEEAGDHGTAARALTLLGSVAMDSGQLSTAAELLEDGVTLARKAGDVAALADALGRCGHAYVLAAQPRTALPLLAECDEVARDVGDRQAETLALIGRGWAGMALADESAEEARVRQALALARSLGDCFGTGETLVLLGELSRRRGDLEDAEKLLEECRQLALSMRAPLLQARALGGLGRLARTRADDQAARAHFDLGIGIARDVGLSYVLTRLLLGASACAHATGDQAAAETVLGDALELSRRQQDKEGEATALFATAVVVRERGDVDRAAALQAEALQMHVDADDDEAIGRSLEGLAGVALDRGQHLLAARLLGAAAATWQQTERAGARWPWEQQRYERDLSRVRATLGAEPLRQAWAEGAERSRGDIVGYALRRAGGRRRTGDGPAGLTGSELDVVRLVVQGLTSREAAERLFVSHRTIDAHLGRIYRKLGIHSRQHLRDLVDELPELLLTDA